MKTFAIGLDFGTSKTAMTWNPTGSVNPNVDNIEIGDGLSPGRTPTCVLRDLKSGKVYIGHTAEEECYMLREEGTNSFRFYSKLQASYPRHYIGYS